MFHSVLGLAPHTGCYGYSYRPQSWYSVNLLNRNTASITQKCINICRGRQCCYAALRYEKCSCFDNLRKYEQKPNRFCNNRCIDETTLRCGGYRGMSVYRLGMHFCFIIAEFCSSFEMSPFHSQSVLQKVQYQQSFQSIVSVVQEICDKIVHFWILGTNIELGPMINF